MTLFDIIYLLTCAHNSTLDQNEKYVSEWMLSLLLAARPLIICILSLSHRTLFIRIFILKIPSLSRIRVRRDFITINWRNFNFDRLELWAFTGFSLYHNSLLFYQSNLTVVFISLLLALLFRRPLKSLYPKMLTLRSVLSYISLFTLRSSI